MYNVGGNNERTNLEITELILGSLSKPDRLISYVTDRLGYDWRYAIDPSHIQEPLGWRPVHTFGTGIRQTIEWYTRDLD